jgi:predicted negative regulator of RcsB-dependent stress response
MLTNGNFWIGVIVGVVLLMGWQRYQARKSAQ